MYKVDCTEAYLLGRFFGDGWFEKRGIAISTTSETDADLISRLIYKVYHKKPTARRRSYNDGHAVYWIRIWSKSICSRYADIFSTTRKKSLTAKSPRITFTDESGILCFVLGVFDAESWTYNWRNRLRISLELYNIEIVEYIEKSLAKYGIRAHLSKCSDGAYRLDITGKPAEVFMNISDMLRKRLYEEMNS